MNIRCPLCGSECYVEGILAEGQHVCCPTCGGKFVYESDGQNPTQETAGQSKLSFVKRNLSWLIPLGMLVLLVSVMRSADFIGGIIFGLLLLGLIIVAILILIPVWMLLWRVHKQAFVSVFDSLEELGEPDFKPRTRAWIILLMYLLGFVSCGLLFALEMLMVIVRANNRR